MTSMAAFAALGRNGHTVEQEISNADHLFACFNGLFSEKAARVQKKLHVKYHGSKGREILLQWLTSGRASGHSSGSSTLFQQVS